MVQKPKRDSASGPEGVEGGFSAKSLAVFSALPEALFKVWQFSPGLKFSVSASPGEHEEENEGNQLSRRPYAIY